MALLGVAVFRVGCSSCSSESVVEIFMVEKIGAVQMVQVLELVSEREKLLAGVENLGVIEGVVVQIEVEVVLLVVMRADIGGLPVRIGEGVLQGGGAAQPFPLLRVGGFLQDLFLESLDFLLEQFELARFLLALVAVLCLNFELLHQLCLHFIDLVLFLREVSGLLQELPFEPGD